MAEMQTAQPVEGSKARPTKANPLAAAQVGREAARAEAESLMTEINDLRRDGPNFDRVEEERLEAARDAALRNLRHADLEVYERGGRCARAARA